MIYLASFKGSLCHSCLSHSFVGGGCPLRRTQFPPENPGKIPRCSMPRAARTCRKRSAHSSPVANCLGMDGIDGNWCCGWLCRNFPFWSCYLQSLFRQRRDCIAWCRSFNTRGRQASSHSPYRTEESRQKNSDKSYRTSNISPMLHTPVLSPKYNTLSVLPGFMLEKRDKTAEIM